MKKNGCRESWLAFCDLEGESSTSRIGSFRGNRFNNLFEAARALQVHRQAIVKFLEEFMPSLNRKQESVLLDAKCEILGCSVTALGIVFESHRH